MLQCNGKLYVDFRKSACVLTSLINNINFITLYCFIHIMFFLLIQIADLKQQVSQSLQEKKSLTNQLGELQNDLRE